MGILNTVLGNASSINQEEIQTEYNAILCEGEKIEKAFKLLRDKVIFTNKRFIIQDIQGMTGKKKEYFSVPYHSVQYFSIETAGTFDMDAELKIWIRGCDSPLEQKFGRGSNIFEVQQILAKHVL